MAEKEEYIIPEGNMHDVYTLLIVHNFTPEDFNRTEELNLMKAYKSQALVSVKKNIPRYSLFGDSENRENIS